jgi:hypothetical protein
MRSRADPSSGEAWSAMANVKTLSFSSDDIGRMLAFISRQDVPRKPELRSISPWARHLRMAGPDDRSFTHYRQGNELQAIDQFRCVKR